MPAIVPTLSPDWVHPRMVGTTDDGQSLVDLVASSPLSWDDLMGISITANSRFKLGQLSPDEANQKAQKLEASMATLKQTAHALEVEVNRWRDELAVCRSALAEARRKADDLVRQCRTSQE